MLTMRTGSVLIEAYETGTRNDGTEMRRRDGSPVEFVVYRAEFEPRARRTLLDPGVNGSRVKPGTQAELLIETELEPDARTGRDGRPYVTWAVKQRITGFVETKPAS